MRILLKVADEPGEAYLVSSLRPSSAAQVMRLVETGQYSQAMVAALSGGGLIEEVRPADWRGVKATLVITRNSAHWDLCGK